MALTPKQKLFVQEYLIDLNATQAAIRAGYSPKTAEQQASRLLSNVKVQEAIREAQSHRAARTEITADMVLQRWWDIATADPNELIHLRRLACRYCHGKDHQYQWLDEEEYTQAVKDAIDSAESESKKQDRPVEAILPSEDGGYGFDRLADPHPKCPKCRGEGRADLHIEDTRKLKGGARLLYAGIKENKNGIEVIMQDQAKALENVARHLGMFVDKVQHSGNVDLNMNNPYKDLTTEELRKLARDG
ncbi:terminase small subunit [Paenibacillus riograndensis]|uniref:Terminase small subunit n=1 Tax=Paenibacillus riograndensis SBR5 TaxID=1073571 RepID=A0A0E4H6T9_9BACL|nr:terminase small subunit [Paenibacillus riograndensis]CQR51464.1 terminase small subunit [Paenibacillus riograndensis SBR5]